MASRLPEPLRVARSVALAMGVHSLLSDALSNPKVAKSSKARRAFTAPMHLAPAASAGYASVCAYAERCEALCLDGSGNPAYVTGKARARRNRTALWFHARSAFLTLLTVEIAQHVARARSAKLRPAVRLNATSDILWERYPVTVPPCLAKYLRDRYRVRVKSGEHACIMDAFPRVQFYDYTKVPVRYRQARLPRNYHLTYSFDPGPRNEWREALAAGFNVAVPFQGRTLPDGFAGHVVIDGDLHDYRPADPRGPVIVGLRFKRITSPHVIARVGAHAARTGEGFAVSAN